MQIHAGHREFLFQQVSAENHGLEMLEGRRRTPAADLQNAQRRSFGRFGNRSKTASNRRSGQARDFPGPAHMAGRLITDVPAERQVVWRWGEGLNCGGLAEQASGQLNGRSQLLIAADDSGRLGMSRDEARRQRGAGHSKQPTDWQQQTYQCSHNDPATGRKNVSF